MSSVIDKIKHYIEIWKIEKYTRRRTFMPEYDAKDKEYYDRYYQDGVYYTSDNPPPPTTTQHSSPLRAIQRAPSIATKRATRLLRGSSKRGLPVGVIPRCSETYNASITP